MEKQFVADSSIEEAAFSRVDRSRTNARSHALKLSTKRFIGLTLTVILVWTTFFTTFKQSFPDNRRFSHIPLHAAETLQKCAALSTPAGPPKDFHSRTESDRYAAGTKPVLLKNATIWTGDVDGFEVVVGDVLLLKGLIKGVGADVGILDAYDDLVTVDVKGAWVSPGIVDLHSHIGVGSSPSLSGSGDTNSRAGIVQPWLRSLDGLNTHDDSYQLSIAGGLTTAVVLPGSANAVGGQAFAIKLRPTAERSSSSLLLEPPFSIVNGTQVDPTLPPRWRILKQACGENPSRVYDGTRMDTIWAFRKGYDTARSIKIEQDNYCAKATAGEWEGLGAFPEDLQWEMLVDVLRGRVKIQNHCYEAVDLDGIVRLTNEFKFSIAAFHHAHETYLVPDLLKKAYGTPPAVALFATNGRYKREAYRGSEFAPRILADNGLSVVMKSDHPVLNSRYLVYEAQQAHYYGLPYNLALASVTTTPAKLAGLDHRVGFVKPGYDADIVVWDSHPLALGATPKQVYIDGIPQLSSPFTSPKPPGFNDVPKTPNFDKEAEDAVKYEGLPPLDVPGAEYKSAVFVNVGSVFLKNSQTRTIKQVLAVDGKALSASAGGVVVVRDGTILCTAAEEGGCSSSIVLLGEKTQRIDLEGGSISPGLITYGGPIGLSHITGEVSTSDGVVLDPLSSRIPDLLGGDRGAIIRAVDGLEFGSRDTLLAYRSGVTAAVTAPVSQGFLRGLSTAFSTGAKHKLESGAIVKEVTAVHVALSLRSNVSVSSQVAALRSLLQGGAQDALGENFAKVVKGEIPLVIEVSNADIIASLILLKSEIEASSGTTLKFTLSGAHEAHLLAREIAEAGVGVIVSPTRPFPSSWEQKRILPGPPLSRDSNISILKSHNVTVGVGIQQQWQARNTRFDIAWAVLESGGELSKSEALALASVNLDTLLGLAAEEGANDLVITKSGEIFDLKAKVVGIVSGRKGVVELF